MESKLIASENKREMPPLSKFLNAFLDILENENITYIVTTNHEYLPALKDNKITFLIDENHEQRFLSLAMSAFKKFRLSIVQSSTGYGGGRLYLSEFSSNSLSEILQMDYCTRIHYYGVPLLNTEIMLKTRKKKGGVFIPSKGAEAALSLILPLIRDGKINDDFKDVIHAGVFDDRETFEGSFKPYLINETIDLIVNTVYMKKNELLNSAKDELLTTYIEKNFFLTIFGFIRHIAGFFHRLLHPPGIFVTISGPDGAGKSFAINKSSVALNVLYPGEKFVKLLWRPGKLPQVNLPWEKSGSYNNDRAIKQKSQITSFFKWVYYSFDYILGFYLKILPLKVKSAAVVMNRYYYDIVVEPSRYGLNLPKRLLKTVLPIIPVPDLPIYFDNAPAELHRCKQKLPLGELSLQVDEWRDFVQTLPGAKIIVTDKPLETVVNDVVMLVLKKRAEMTKKALKTDPDESSYLWDSDLSGGYLSFPSKKNCRLIIPANPVVARRAWEMFIPSDFAGRFYARVLKSISLSAFRNLLKNRRIAPLSDEDSLELKTSLEDIFKTDDFVPAISIGESGPFRWITGMIVGSDSRILGYLKIGESPLAIEKIKNEARILTELKNRWLKNNERISFPELLFEGELGNGYGIVHSAAPFEGKTGKIDFNNDYADILKEILKQTSFKKVFSSSALFRNLKTVSEFYPLPFRELMQTALKVIEGNIGKDDVLFSLSHGDFVPYNIIISKGKEVFIKNWESASFEEPAGIDFVHFFFQAGFMKKLGGKKLLDFISKEIQKWREHLPDGFETKIIILLYLLNKSVKEDLPDLLNKAAVERRKLMQFLIRT